MPDREREVQQRPSSAPDPARAARSPGPQVHGGTPAWKSFGSIQRLQAQVGNRALAADKARGLRSPSASPQLQRHTVDGAPSAPAPLSEEELVPLQGHWGREVQRAVSGDPVVQRFKKGGGSLGSVGLSAKDLQADGSSTLSAKVSRPGKRSISWSLTGPAGTTIDPATGQVKAGATTGKDHFAKVVVTAADAALPAVKASRSFTLWSSDAWQAKIDVKDLRKSGPLTKKGFKASFNGIYDATWTPSKRLLQISVPIQFDFPDNAITAKMSSKAKERERARMRGFRYMFISNTQRQWGGRFTFAMAREPKQLWGALGPVRVNVKVFEPKNKADAYFTVIYKSKTVDRAGVTFPKVELFKGDLTPDRVFRKDTLAGEAKMLKQIANPVNVDATGKLDPASKATIAFIGDYVKRLRQPPIRIALEGHDPTKSSAALRKARVVQAALREAGVRGIHHVSATGVVTKADTQVHMTPRVSSSYVNMSDVSAHEFGHMIGLPDEYPEGARKIGDKLRTFDRLEKAFGTDYANQVGKVTPNTASIMHGGDQVRVQHYIHFWDTLILVSNLHASAPVKKFGDPDWKING